MCSINLCQTSIFFYGVQSLQLVQMTITHESVCTSTATSWQYSSGFNVGTPAIGAKQAESSFKRHKCVPVLLRRADETVSISVFATRARVTMGNIVNRCRRENGHALLDEEAGKKPTRSDFAVLKLLFVKYIWRGSRLFVAILTMWLT
jgi:hypothetical protein